MPEVGLCGYAETDRYEIYVVGLEGYGAISWWHDSDAEMLVEAAHAYLAGRLGLEEVRDLPLTGIGAVERAWNRAAPDAAEQGEDAVLVEYLEAVAAGALATELEEQWMDDTILTGATADLALPGFARTSIMSEGGPGTGYDTGAVYVAKPFGYEDLVAWQQARARADELPVICLDDWALLHVLADAGEDGVPGAEAWYAAAADWLERTWDAPPPPRDALRRIRRTGWVSAEGRAPVRLRLAEMGRQVLATASVP